MEVIKENGYNLFIFEKKQMGRRATIKKNQVSISSSKTYGKISFSSEIEDDIAGKKLIIRQDDLSQEFYFVIGKSNRGEVVKLYKNTGSQRTIYVVNNAEMCRFFSNKFNDGKLQSFRLEISHNISKNNDVVCYKILGKIQE